jgi:hypothetical protein
MAKSHSRPKARQKKKLATNAKQIFNYLLGGILPQFVTNNLPEVCPQVRNEQDLIVFGPTLPLFVRWEKLRGDGKTQHEVSINEFMLDSFLNKYVNPSSPVYDGIRAQVHYYLLIQLSLLGYRRIPATDEVLIEPPIVEAEQK